MARKTLEEKQIADTRHLYHFEKVVAPQLKKIQTNTHAIVAKDLVKTVLITALILSAQIILFLTLKNHLVRIPGILY